MSIRATRATARRVARQLRHDPRTIGLLLVVPCVLVTLISLVFDDGTTFDRIGAPMLGIFPLLSMFLVTSIAMLRERTTGTLERLLTMPVGKLDILLGYALTFAAVAVVQSLLVSAVALGPLGLEVDGPTWAVVLLAVANAVLGTAMGLLVSAFARTEFQAVQFLPVFLLPQLLMCGLLAPRESMSSALETLSAAFPMTYAFDALDQVGHGGSAALSDVLAIAGFTVAALVLGALTLRRRTA